MGLHDWEKYNRAEKARNGKAYYPWFEKNVTPPSKKQVDFVEHLIHDLESNGVEVSWMDLIQNREYLVNAEICYKLTNQLINLRKKHHISSGTEITYVNLCKEKATGKKIKYKTRTRFAVPVGYELIGELSRNVVILEAV